MAASPSAFSGAAASRPAARRHRLRTPRECWVCETTPDLDGDSGALSCSLSSLWLALSRSPALRLDRGPGSGTSVDALVLSAASRVPEESNLAIASDPSAPARIVLDLCPRVPRGRLPSACIVPARASACSHSTAVPGKATLVAANAAAAAGTWLANTGACGGRSLTQS